MVGPQVERDPERVRQRDERHEKQDKNLREDRKSIVESIPHVDHVLRRLFELRQNGLLISREVRRTEGVDIKFVFLVGRVYSINGTFRVVQVKEIHDTRLVERLEVLLVHHITPRAANRVVISPLLNDALEVNVDHEAADDSAQNGADHGSGLLVDLDTLEFAFSRLSGILVLLLKLALLFQDFHLAHLVRNLVFSVIYVHSLLLGHLDLVVVAIAAEIIIIIFLFVVISPAWLVIELDLLARIFFIVEVVAHGIDALEVECLTLFFFVILGLVHGATYVAILVVHEFHSVRVQTGVHVAHLFLLECFTQLLSTEPCWLHYLFKINQNEYEY